MAHAHESPSSVTSSPDVTAASNACSFSAEVGRRCPDDGELAGVVGGREQQQRLDRCGQPPAAVEEDPFDAVR